jgi:hypothetical protein
MRALHVRVFLERRPGVMFLQVDDQRPDLLGRCLNVFRTSVLERVRLGGRVDQHTRDGDCDHDGNDGDNGHLSLLGF